MHLSPETVDWLHCRWSRSCLHTLTHQVMEVLSLVLALPFTCIPRIYLHRAFADAEAV